MVIKITKENSEGNALQTTYAYDNLIRDAEKSEKLSTIYSIFELSFRKNNEDVYFVDGNNIKYRMKVFTNPDGQRGGWINEKTKMALNVFVGEGSIILASSIGPNSKIGERVYVAGNVIMGKNVTVIDGMWIDSGNEIPDSFLVHTNITK